MFALVHSCVLNQPPRPSRHRAPPLPPSREACGSVPEGFAPFEPHIFALVHPGVLNQPPRPRMYPCPSIPYRCRCPLRFLSIVSALLISLKHVCSVIPSLHPALLLPQLPFTNVTHVCRGPQRFVACRAAMSCDPTCQVWRLLLLQSLCDAGGRVRCRTRCWRQTLRAGSAWASTQRSPLREPLGKPAA